jgi:anti-sigma B factor antagonist
VRTRRVDAAAAPGLKTKVSERFDQGSRKVVLDLADVQFMDSTGLGTLLSLVKRVPPGGSLALCGCGAAVMELMKLTRLDRVFQVFPDAAAATLALAV